MNRGNGRLKKCSRELFSTTLSSQLEDKESEKESKEEEVHYREFVDTIKVVESRSTSSGRRCRYEGSDAEEET